MTYDLYIGDRAFSSWSLRGWLMFEKFGIPVRTHMVGLYSGTMAADLAGLAPARLVPVVRTPQGTPIGESLAIAETLAEDHPHAGLWPADAAQRATARWLCSEMATGFRALRNDCPMQLLRCYTGFTPSDDVLGDLARIETLWSHARILSGAADGCLFGNYTLADVFYTPVAARVIGYGLPMSANARDYCEQLLGDPAVQAWRSEALKICYETEPYRKNLPSVAWPV